MKRAFDLAVAMSGHRRGNQNASRSRRLWPTEKVEKNACLR